MAQYDAPINANDASFKKVVLERNESEREPRNTPWPSGAREWPFMIHA